MYAIEVIVSNDHGFTDNSFPSFEKHTEVARAGATTAAHRARFAGSFGHTIDRTATAARALLACVTIGLRRRTSCAEATATTADGAELGTGATTTAAATVGRTRGGAEAFGGLALLRRVLARTARLTAAIAASRQIQTAAILDTQFARDDEAQRAADLTVPGRHSQVAARGHHHRAEAMNHARLEADHRVDDQVWQR